MCCACFEILCSAMNILVARSAEPFFPDSLSENELASGLYVMGCVHKASVKPECLCVNANSERHTSVTLLAEGAVS